MVVTLAPIAAWLTYELIQKYYPSFPCKLFSYIFLHFYAANVDTNLH